MSLPIEIELGEKIDDRPGTGDVEFTSRVSQDDLHGTMFAGADPPLGIQEARRALRAARRRARREGTGGSLVIWIDSPTSSVPLKTLTGAGAHAHRSPLMSQAITPTASQNRLRPKSPRSMP